MLITRENNLVYLLLLSVFNFQKFIIKNGGNWKLLILSLIVENLKIKFLMENMHLMEFIILILQTYITTRSFA